MSAEPIVTVLQALKLCIKYLLKIQNLAVTEQKPYDDHSIDDNIRGASIHQYANVPIADMNKFLKLIKQPIRYF